MDDGQDQVEDFAELVKGDIINLYKEKSEQAGLQPHDAFIQYLEETYDENDSIDIVIHGNHKYMFTDRITDDHLIVICSTLQRYAIHIEEIDLRYNSITDIGARALGDLISKSVRLLNLNLMGNAIKSEGAQYLAESLKDCPNMQSLNFNMNKIKIIDVKMLGDPHAVQCERQFMIFIKKKKFNKKKKKQKKILKK